VTLRYFAADRQSDARSFVGGPSMEALEHRENALFVLFVEADSVIGDDDLGVAVDGS